MTERLRSPSTQRLRSHAVHATLKQWRDKLPAERPDNFRALDPEPRNAYVRLRWALRELRARIDKLNPFLAQPSILDAVNKHLAELQAPWDQYRSNPTQHWQSLDTFTEGLLNHIRNLPPTDGFSAWQEGLEELRADMNAAINDAQEAVQALQTTASGTDKKFKDVSEKLQGLESEIQAQKARLDQMLTQQSETFTKAEQDRVTQFTKAEQDRSQKFNQTQDEKKAQFDALVANFNKSQADRKTQFDSLVTDFVKTKTEIFEQHEAELAALVKTSNAKSDATLAKIQEQLDKAVEIVGTIVKTTMSGNYQVIANREYWNAWIMRGIAIFAFLGMGGMIIWAVSEMKLGANGIDWSTVAIRLSLGFAFLIPGFYCAKESSRHWTAEKQNRRISLELAALDPFLVKLDEEKRKGVIEKMAGEYFGAKSPQEESEDSISLKDIHFSGRQLAAIAKEIVKILRAK